MKKVLYLLVGLLLLASCDQDSTLTLTPDITSMSFGPEGGTFTSVIFTNGIWTATCDDEAVSFTPSSGDYSMPMHITVGKNEEHFTKSIRISIVSDLGKSSRNGKIFITQDCYPFIICENPEQTVGAEGGDVRFQVNSNDPWHLTGTAIDGASAQFPVWPDSGERNKTEVKLSIPANTTGAPRTFTATLALSADASQSVVLTVRQGA